MASGLTLKSITVPPHKVIGDKAKLICKFDMGLDTLYSVKWYKDDLEFYRFVPNDRPRLQVFAQKGVNVDKNRSTRTHVTLSNLTLDSGGTYKCEVSAEAPSFRTKSAFQDMVVVVKPSRTEIIGAAPKYAVGDTVNVTCYSYRSKPAASLTWKVNDVEVSPNYEPFVNNFGNDFMRDLKHKSGNTISNRRRKTNSRRQHFAMQPVLREYKPQVEVDGTLETSALGLSFKVLPMHAKNGLKLECTTSIGKAHWQSIQEKIPVKARAKLTTSSGGGSFWPGSTSGGGHNLGRLLILSYLLPAVVIVACVL